MGTEERTVGAIFESGYWQKQSLVTEVKVGRYGTVWFTEVDPDGRVRHHCTPADERDRIVVPQFEHDCDGCTFLGSTGRWATRTADFYFCPGEPTVIARYSSLGWDYSSGIESQTELLKEALMRARSWGFYTG